MEPPKPEKPKIKAVVYAHTHCVEYRENAVDALAEIVPVHAIGKCHGNSEKVKVIHKVRAAAKGWIENSHLFQGYAFVFAAENEPHHWNYLTEKIIMPFKAGAIPIFDGHKSTLSDYFNTKAIVQLNKNTPTRVAKLLKDDAYMEVRSQPMLRRTITDTLILIRTLIESALNTSHVRKKIF